MTRQAVWLVVAAVLASCGHAAPVGHGPIVSTLAGNGTDGSVDGPPSSAQFDGPYTLAVDSSGSVWVTDRFRVRKIAPDGQTSTVAGNGTAGYVDGTGGPHGTTEFNILGGIALDKAGNCYVGDGNNARIRKIGAGGATSTLAGNGVVGFVDGTGGACGTAELSGPVYVSTDANQILVADLFNDAIRAVSLTDGSTTTLAGNGLEGWVDGSGGRNGRAEFRYPSGVTSDSQGYVYVSDGLNQRIRKLDPLGNTTTLTGNGVQGFADGTGGPEGSAELNTPVGIVVATDGSLYIGDMNNHRIRKVAPNGDTTTIAGNGSAGYADGDAASAEFHRPAGLALDAAGNLYVADSDNNRIRKITFPALGGG